MTHDIKLIVAEFECRLESSYCLYYMWIGISYRYSKSLYDKPIKRVCKLLYMQYQHLHHEFRCFIISALNFYVLIVQSSFIDSVNYCSLIFKSVSRGFSTDTPAGQINKLIAVILSVPYSLVVRAVEHDIREHICIFCLLMIHRLRFTRICIVITKLCIFRSQIKAQIQLCISHPKVPPYENMEQAHLCALARGACVLPKESSRLRGSLLMKIYSSIRFASKKCLSYR